MARTNIRRYTTTSTGRYGNTYTSKPTSYNSYYYSSYYSDDGSSAQIAVGELVRHQLNRSITAPPPVLLTPLRFLLHRCHIRSLCTWLHHCCHRLLPAPEETKGPLRYFVPYQPAERFCRYCTVKWPHITATVVSHHV